MKAVTNLPKLGYRLAGTCTNSFLLLARKSCACQCLKDTQKKRIKRVMRDRFYLNKILKGEGRHHVSQQELGKHDVSNISPNATI